MKWDMASLVSLIISSFKSLLFYKTLKRDLESKILSTPFYFNLKSSRHKPAARGGGGWVLARYFPRLDIDFFACFDLLGQVTNNFMIVSQMYAPIPPNTAHA